MTAPTRLAQSAAAGRSQHGNHLLRAIGSPAQPVHQGERDEGPCWRRETADTEYAKHAHRDPHWLTVLQ